MNRKKKKEVIDNIKEKIDEVQTICYKIINSIKNENDEKREYNFLDYNHETKLTLYEFAIILKNNITLNHQDLIKVNKFIQKQLPSIYTNPPIPEIISDYEIKKITIV